MEEVQCGNEKKGLEVGIAIISKFRNYDFEAPYTSSKDFPALTEHYCKHIHTQWGVGDATCNNGLMVFISIQDRHLYISTGKGIKHIITDHFIEKWLIPNTMAPWMKQQRYDQALLEMLLVVQEIIENQHDLSKSSVHRQYDEQVKSTERIEWIVMSIIGAVILGV
ncbi:hypothetical protein RFI_38609, partial [Reticulomyxa filosa]